ncbi:MAG: hypothetical protein FJZ01_09445 [Candidatus Sericytochromatia bacterium]|nr:hypothetical protein [Candidatus Tanganyikabacteria bacterium]
MRHWALVFAALLPGAAVPAAWALGNERSGVAIAIPPDRSGYVRELRRAIQESGRFQLVQPAPTGVRIKLPEVLPVPAFTVPARNTLKSRTNARWLLFGDVARRTETIEEFGTMVATTSLDVSARAFDLDMGDFSQLMTLTSRDPAELAAQTLKYLRVAYPLQGQVTAVRDGTVYLDLGRKNGVDRGSYFVIRRKAGAYSEKVATVLVTSSSDWYAVAEVDEQILGKRVLTGDAAVEDTSAILARP